MGFYGLVLGALCVWRITHLIHAEDGPWDIVAQLRRKAGKSFWGRLMDCFYCLSLWTAVPFALLIGGGWKERALLWPALSAGAIMLESVNTRIAIPPARYYEEDPDVLLREEEGGTGGLSEPADR